MLKISLDKNQRGCQNLKRADKSHPLNGGFSNSNAMKVFDKILSELIQRTISAN